MAALVSSVAFAKGFEVTGALNDAGGGTPNRLEVSLGVSDDVDEDDDEVAPNVVAVDPKLGEVSLLNVEDVVTGDGANVVGVLPKREFPKGKLVDAEALAAKLKVERIAADSLLLGDSILVVSVFAVSDFAV